MNNLLAEFLIRECTENYSIKLSDIPLVYVQLIISIKDDIDKDNAIWNDITKWFNKKNNVPKHIGIGKLQEVLKKKWDNLLENDSFKIKVAFSQQVGLINSARQKNGLTENKNVHRFDNPGCIVDQNGQTLIHLGKVNDSNALLQATKAVNEYYFHLIDENNASHRSKKFCENFIEHFGGYRLYTDLPYTSIHTASTHNTDHQICVDNLLRSLVPLSNFVNRFIQDNYGNMYLKLRQLSLGPFVPKPFGIFPIIAINFNTISDYHWDVNDAPNCLCCLVSLGNFQGGELYFPQLYTLIPLQPGKVVAFSSHYLLHGNFPLICGVNNIRHSIVYFVHNNFFHKEDNFNNMEIDNAELNQLGSGLYNNQGLNSKTPTFTRPRKFQTKKYANDDNDINQRQKYW